MTYQDVQKLMHNLDMQVAKSHNARIVLITLAIDDENGQEIVQTAFNPHMRICKCKECENLVTIVKKQVNNTGPLGELPV